MVAGHALPAHRAEVVGEPGPELLQAHVPDASAPVHARAGAPAPYAGSVFPSTGSTTWDLVLEIGIALALLVSLVLLYRNYRGR